MESLQYWPIILFVCITLALVLVCSRRIIRSKRESNTPIELPIRRNASRRVNPRNVNSSRPVTRSMSARDSQSNHPMRTPTHTTHRRTSDHNNSYELNSVQVRVESPDHVQNPPPPYQQTPPDYSI